MKRNGGPLIDAPVRRRLRQKTPDPTFESFTPESDTVESDSGSSDTLDSSATLSMARGPLRKSSDIIAERIGCAPSA
eukprot:1184202-Alexandrium_andersonii.AAC.1